MTMFAGRIALVTGGGRGIGLAIAIRLGASGASIVIADLDPAAGAEGVATLAEQGVPAHALVCDVADEAAVEIMVAAALAHYGGIDILINNAGKHLLAYAVPITALPRAEWRRLLDVNIIGVVNCAAAVRASMATRGGGVIVNIGSTAGIAGNSCYGVSKLAVRGLTVGLAQEFASDNIRVCAVAPGLVDSPAAMAELPEARRAQFARDLQLVKRPGRMADVAGAVHFLCSDDAAFITGETLVVSGGFPLHV